MASGATAVSLSQAELLMPKLHSDIAEHILALERAALDRWGRGDPSGYLEISAPDVVYFDPYLPAPINGLPALTDYYEGIRGKVHVDRDEITNATVQVCDEIAVLTFNYTSYSNQSQLRWNSTEVYRLHGDAWRIIHSHWSYTQRV
jgi:ketosteroid isomerase-like protein